MHWDQFHFIRPEGFYLILPAFLLWFGVRYILRHRSGWQGVIASHLYQSMLGTETKKVSQIYPNLLLLGWLVGIFALAGPTWERLPQPVYQVQTGHVVVIDMSLSMRATDVAPDRLTRAKYKAIDLVNYIDEGELGLVAYAGDAFVISPLTSDSSNITTLLPSLSPEIMPVPGSDPLLGLSTAVELLTNAGYQKGFIYWITDGIELSQVAELKAFVSQQNFNLNVMAVGTENGAPIKQLNGELLKEPSGAIVIPKVHMGYLQTLSKAGNGRFSTMTADEQDITYLASLSALEAQQEAEEEANDNTGDQWVELGPFLLLGILPFAALAFRRGLLAIVLVIGMGSMPVDKSIAQVNSPAPAPVDAMVQAEAEKQAQIPWWKKPFLNADQQGHIAYENGLFSNATSTFDSAQWKGTAAYRAGDYETALSEFSKLDTIDGKFNQSNALAQLGQLDAAIEKLNDVLAQQPDHQDALANKALLEQLKEQQDSQQQNDQNQQSDQNEQSDSSNQDSNEENQSGEQGEQQEQSGQQQGQQGESDNQEQQEPTPNEQQSQEQSEDSNGEQQEQETDSQESQNQSEQQSGQDQTGQASVGDELTEEEKEQQQRLENLMRRIPDDPAFLLKRKMQLEAQKRKRERAPASQRSNW